jgi:uncharacterized protein
LIVIAGAYNNNHPRIKEISIELPRKSSNITELNVFFASDFHLEADSDGLLDRFVDQTNAMHPDVILIGGDILGPGGNRKNREFAMKFRRLSAKYGIYAIQGNHDSEGSDKSDRTFFAEAGMKLVEDNTVNIDNSFYIAGREAYDTIRSAPIRKALESATNDLPIILLDHEPTDLENVSRTPVDLQLSGHTHNEQLFPANLLVAPFEYELAHGAKIRRSTLFIVSSGVH